ncbi:MAG: regulatory iron-sulfur-containing complex subunit RicT [Bacteroidota bacterium]
MGCSSCGSGSPAGCGNKGHCTTGGCNKRNTYDWISVLDIHDPSAFKIVEVSFKKGSRKDFFINETWSNAVTGDMVVVETDSGLDTGAISLSGELVRAQMKKKRVNAERISHKVIRKANHRDLEKLKEARNLEKQTLVRSRVIARTLGLEMKIGDIEFQGDKRKATFYYTAEGRVDFRELVRSYAKEFRVKVEMRQIGARQESARIGGIGSCGRELCCSTWLSDFQSVTTTAARYQNIAINQTKLSGQCGRLKCCLNYELDTYMDALKDFPKGVDYVKTKRGKAALIKTDIFKGIMYYGYTDEKVRSPMVALDIKRVKKIQELNKAGEFPDELIDREAILDVEAEVQKEIDYEDVTGQIELPNIKKNKRRKKRKKRPSNSSNKRESSDNKGNQPKQQGANGKQNQAKSEDSPKKQPSNRRRKNRRRPNRKPGNQGSSNTNKTSKE